MKRAFVCTLVVLALFAFFGCNEETDDKEKIFNIVEDSYEQITKSCETKDMAALLTIKNVKEIDTIDGYIIFCCERDKNPSNSHECGFYYSENNTPVAISDGQIICYNEGMNSEGKGNKYVDSLNNEYYTEHIKGNLYFYSASLS